MANTTRSTTAIEKYLPVLLKKKNLLHNYVKHFKGVGILLNRIQLTN